MIKCADSPRLPQDLLDDAFEPEDLAREFAARMDKGLPDTLALFRGEEERLLAVQTRLQAVIVHAQELEGTKAAERAAQAELVRAEKQREVERKAEAVRAAELAEQREREKEAARKRLEQQEEERRQERQRFEEQQRRDRQEREAQQRRYEEQQRRDRQERESAERRYQQQLHDERDRAAAAQAAAAAQRSYSSYDSYGGGGGMGGAGLGFTQTTGNACKNCSAGRGCRWAGQGRPGHN